MFTIGRKFTWSNNQDKLAMSRINRFLFSKYWKDQFPGVVQVALPRGLFYHTPIKISSMEANWGLKPFRFENCWFKHKEFLFMAKECWISFQAHGFAGFKVTKNCKCLKKKKIKVWKREVFGSIEFSRSTLVKELEPWDLVEETRELNQVEITTKGDTTKKLWDISCMVDVSWRQNSRVLWFKEGDKNTKFFHQMESIKKRRNLISKIKRGHHFTENPIEIKEEIAKYF